MAGRLKGKVALVTAAGQGIGRAIAQAFVAEGAKVIATDLDVKKLKGIKRATLAKLDARSTADVKALVNAMSKKLGTIDVLVNAAGYVHHGSVLDCTEKDWDFSFDLNVKSMHRTIKAFLPAMLAKKTGASEKTVRQQFIDRQPMGRLGTPQEIAALAVYLASDESSYTTGQIHLADGGFAL